MSILAPLIDHWQLLIQGLAITVALACAGLLGGVLIAIPCALARLRGCRSLGLVAFFYSYLFRGTPLLAQLFLVYFGAGQLRSFLEPIGLWVVLREPIWCVLIVFSLNSGAYQSELLRGAILAVPRGEVEAARAFGMSAWLELRLIVAPHVARIALRSYGNEVILMIKGSAVASLVTIHDLMGATRHIYAQTYDFGVYLWAAVAYLGVAEAVRLSWNRIERRLTLANGHGAH